MTTNELFLPFAWDGISWSFYVTVNMLVAACCTVSIALMAWHNPRHFARPAFLLAALTHFIFQWPMAIFSQIFERSLTDFWFFAISVHTVVVVALLWIVMTHRLTEQVIPSGPTPGSSPMILSRKGRVLLFGSLIGLAVVYLVRVGWSCTGLYAMLFDPVLTLLARETSIKLVGSGFATLAYGILANVICPLSVYMSVLSAQVAVERKQFLRACVWAGVGLCAVLVVLLPGAKGALIPTIIVTGIGLVHACRTWLNRVSALLILLIVGFSLFSVFELIRERKVFSGVWYDYGVCANRLNACAEAKTLLDSLRFRDGSLGLTGSRLDRLDLQLYCACTPLAKYLPVCGQSQMATSDASESEGPPFFKSIEEFGHGFRSLNRRYRQYAAAILYRMNVVPIQVASWHFRYVEEYGSPGVYALPFAIKFVGSSIDVPNLVHMVYGKIYSDGDQTSTGTAPTSFLVAYPAYFKLWGLCLAVGAMLLFDLLASTVLARTGPALRWAGIGLVSVGCINFLLSDFGTALLSHGTAFALILLMALAFIEKLGAQPK